MNTSYDTISLRAIIDVAKHNPTMLIRPQLECLECAIRDIIVKAEENACPTHLNLMTNILRAMILSLLKCPLTAANAEAFILPP